MSERIKKVNSLIKHEVTGIISKELDIKNSVFITISKVDTSADLSKTRISVLVFPSKESNYGIKTLENEHYIIQKKLHKSLHLKILPKIEFVLDTSGEDVDTLNALLKSQ